MFTRDKFEQLCKKAQKHVDKHEFVAARDYYLECLSIRPNDVGILNNLAQIHNILNEKEKAKGYNEILLNECDKQSAIFKKEHILTFKINALVSLKRNDEANVCIDELLRISPDDEVGLFYKTQYLHENGRYKESLKYLDKILSNNPNDIQALLLKGISLVEINEYEKAERCYNRVFEINPKNKSAMNLKSELLKKRFKITLTPHDIMLKAFQYWEMNDLKSAECFFEKALDMNQKYDEIWFNQGVFLIKMRKITKAITSFEKAFELNPKSGGVKKQEKLFRILKIMKFINRIFGHEK